MANIIIKSDERRALERKIARDFEARATGEGREAVEVIAAKSREAYVELKRMEERNR